MNEIHQNIAAVHEDLRGRVIDTAKKAFFVKGVKAVTMDGIAHDLTMSKRTLYQIFADKETLLLACLEESNKLHAKLMNERQQVTDNVLEIVLFDLGERLRVIKEINPLFFTELSRFPRIVAHLRQERLLHMERAVEFLQRGVMQGLFRKDVDFRIVFTLLMDHLDGARNIDALGKYSPTEVFQHLVFFYLRGCTTPKGMAMMDEFLEQSK